MSVEYKGPPPTQRRRTDGWFGWLTRVWDWVDSRDIDKHIVSVVIMWGTYRLTAWSMEFAALTVSKPGYDVAATIAAVTGPYMALQAAAIKFYFDSRGKG